MIDALMESSGLQFREVKTALEGLVTDSTIERPQRTNLVLPKGIGDLLRPHRDYLRGRGFKVKTLEKLWGLRGIGVASRLSWRIWIPIHFQGEIVSWTTRGLHDEGTRYVSASVEEESLNHKEILYGEDYCRHSCIVHEGLTDVWATGPGATATFGTSFTRAQVLRISRFPIRAICFDNEPDAQHRAEDLCDQLMHFHGETFNVVLDAKDAGSSKKKELKELRRRFL